MRSLRLNRRTFLRGTGVAIALPTLEAMMDGRGLFHGMANAQAASPPRLITFHFPHGVLRPYWEPTATGTGFPMSPNLMALEPFRNDINVVSGLANPTGFEAAGGGQHAQGMATFANGTICTAKGAGGPTIDQVAAAQFGGSSKFRSLVMNNEPATRNTDEFTTAHTNNISWSAKETFVPPMRDPTEIFAQLFTTPVGPPPTGAGGTTGTTTPPPVTGLDMAQQRKKSILDFVAAQNMALAQRLGGEDRSRLDQHLTSIRELERQVTTPVPGTPTTPGGGGAGGAGGSGGSGGGGPTVTCTQPTSPGTALPADQRAYANLTLMAAALRCGLTRYASFAMANAFLTTGLPGFPNIKEYHAFVHREVTATDEEVGKAVNYFVDKFAFFLNLLKTSDDGGGKTVLDNSIIFFSSEMALGTHYRDPMPVVLAGKAGGVLKTGRHLSYPGANIGRLLLTVLKLAGVNVNTFGRDGTSPLSELLS